LTQTDPRASPCPPGSRASRTRNSRACTLSRPTAERGKRPGCPLEVGGAARSARLGLLGATRALALHPRVRADARERMGDVPRLGGLLPHAHQRPADSDRERRRPDNPWRGADWENGPGVAGVPDRPDEREGSEPPPRPQVAGLAWASPWVRRLPRRARRRVRSSRRDADRRMPVAPTWRCATLVALRS
jgi:hypothetical protein